MIMKLHGKSFGADCSSPLKERLYVIIFESDTRPGKLFDLLLIVSIALSVAVVMLDSVSSFRQAYSTGRGRIILRGLAHIDETKTGRYRIVITEIPFQLNKTNLIERIASLARSGKIAAISDLRDESDRNGMSIVIELKRGTQPRKVLNQLYKYTPLQSTFGVQLLALVNGEPRLLSLKRALYIYIEHRLDVLTRRTQFELKKARARAHILSGLLIALANLDEVIQTIRQSPRVDVAKERLITRFNLSDYRHRPYSICSCAVWQLWNVKKLKANTTN